MITIECFNHSCGIKITNDRTYQELVIYPRDYDHQDEIIAQLLKEFIEEE